MNKHRFRLVFSKALGFLVPVAENTRAQRKSGHPRTSAARPRSVVPAHFSLKPLGVLVLLASNPNWATAQVTVDPNAPATTQVGRAANGVPVIDISAPNSTGLSHNRFSEFDVQNPGIIFNNSLVTGKSQLGGVVLLNPNLQRTATAILSEVTGNRPSSISGTLEVFGDKADLLIANPNGVTLNGVTTLNTASLTLSTGHVNDADASLQLLVDGASGQVVIGADGVNTEGLSYFDIVARTVALQGALGSKARKTDLQLAAGQGTYTSATRTFTAVAHAQGAGVAISGSAAGAMYGRHIQLFSSDSGAGVRHAGVLLAANDIQISANGDIQLHEAAASGALKIDAAGRFSTTRDALVTAGSDLRLDVGSFQNSGTLYSKNTASLSLKNAADLLIDTSFNAPQADGLLTLSAHDITLTDALTSGGSVSLNATGDVRNRGAVMVGKTLAITAKGLIDNAAGKLIWAGGDLVLNAGTSLLNGLDSQLLAMGSMSLSAGQTIQNNAGRIEAQGSLAIDTPLLENLSQGSGGLKKVGVAEENALYDDDYGPFETQYFRTQITLPLYASDLRVKQAVIKAGGDLLISPGTAKDTAARVRNVGGLVAATGNVSVEGDLENLGISINKSVLEVLKEAQSRTRWTVSSIVVSDDAPVYGSLYDLMQRTFGGDFSNQWVNALKKIQTPEVNQLISAVLGADWKAYDQWLLQKRWAAFLASHKSQSYYADQQAEMSAGAAFIHRGGSFSNGDGANWGAQRPITVQVGSESVHTLDGDLDAQFNAKRASADKALKQQLDNPLFQRNQTGDAFGRIKPLYETRVKYLDQTRFLGSEYFLQKIGYDPGKTVSVVGDAYFDNQLILHSVEQRLGNFVAQTLRISGTDLARQLLDNGAALALSAGLTPGNPLTDSQIAGLEKDVVWYEFREIDGQRVLAPRVYLSQKTLAARDRDARSAALVAADAVLIDANAVNNVNGTVRGATDTFVYASTDINNIAQGGSQAGFFAGQGGKNEKAGQLVAAAEGHVRNQGGVMSGFEQTVVGSNGISSSATTGYDRNGYLVVRDNGMLGTALSADSPAVAPAPQTAAEAPSTAAKAPAKVAAPEVRALFDARLNAGPVNTAQGSSLSLISGGTLDLTGAITMADNVSLHSTGDLNLNDLHEARSAFDSVSKGGFLSQVHITEMAASANSVGNTVNAKNLEIKTGGNLSITGGEINARNSAIEVGGSSTVYAGKDLTFHEKAVETTQFVIGGGVGGGGYEATGHWGSAADVDTQLAAPFGGKAGDDHSPRGDVSAGRAAAAQALASTGTGARSGANKGRGGTNGVNVKIGMETVTTTDTRESATYRNAHLNLGNGSVKVGGSLDIGGADINAGYALSPEERAGMTPEQRKAAVDSMPTLAMSAAAINTTKVENTEKTQHTRDEVFTGVTVEAHSSAVDLATQASNLAHKALGTDGVKDPNAPADASKTLATSDLEMDVDPALTALAGAGMLTQAAFGEVAGVSATIGFKHTTQKSDARTRSEHINQLGGNLSLTSTQGDIELNGVNLQGGNVAIKSAGNLSQRAAKSSATSHDSTTTQSAGLTLSTGVAPTGAGTGISLGADGSGDQTTTTSTSYTNGLISGTEMSIETKGDHTLVGSTIKGNKVAVTVGGNQTITSVQDTADMKHERNNWSVSVGMALTTAGLVGGTGSASVSFGKDSDRSKLVAEQAGISGDQLALDVTGNLNLTGAHITSQKGQGNVQVGGQLNSHTLQDSREKDGGYGGGGGGISKNGLPSVTLEFGRVDQVHYSAMNAATIDVGDTKRVTATKGISGPLNTLADTSLDVTQNKRVAGTDVKIEMSFGDAKALKEGVKKRFTSKAGAAPTAIPNVYVSAPAATPKFDQRVIVNTDPTNPTVSRAVQSLATKNPGSVVVVPAGNGSHSILQGALATGTTKVEVVGHHEGATLGGLNKQQIADVVKSLANDSTTTFKKVALVGCGTACAKDGPSLVTEVADVLQQPGAAIAVKGYETPIRVSAEGRKRRTGDDDPDALVTRPLYTNTRVPVPLNQLGTRGAAPSTRKIFLPDTPPAQRPSTTVAGLVAQRRTQKGVVSEPLPVIPEHAPAPSGAQKLSTYLEQNIALMQALRVDNAAHHRSTLGGLLATQKTFDRHINALQTQKQRLDSDAPATPLQLVDEAIQAHATLESAYKKINGTLGHAQRWVAVKKALTRSPEATSTLAAEQKSLNDSRDVGTLIRQNQTSTKNIALLNREKEKYVSAMPPDFTDKRHTLPGGGASETNTYSVSSGVSYGFSGLPSLPVHNAVVSKFSATASVGGAVNASLASNLGVSQANDGNYLMSDNKTVTAGVSGSANVGMGTTVGDRQFSRTKLTFALEAGLRGGVSAGGVIVQRTALTSTPGDAFDAQNLLRITTAKHSTTASSKLGRDNRLSKFLVSPSNLDSGALSGLTQRSLEQGYGNEAKIQQRLLAMNVAPEVVNPLYGTDTPLAHLFMHPAAAAKPADMALLPRLFGKALWVTENATQTTLATSTATGARLNAGGIFGVGGSKSVQAATSWTNRTSLSAKLPHNAIDPALTSSTDLSGKYLHAYFSNTGSSHTLDPVYKPISRLMGYDSTSAFMSAMARIGTAPGDLPKLPQGAAAQLAAEHAAFTRDATVIQQFANQSDARLRKAELPQAREAIDRLSARYGLTPPSDKALRTLAANGGKSTRSYGDFLQNAATIEEAYSATAAALKVAATLNPENKFDPKATLQMHGPWQRVTPVRTAKQEAYRQAADTLYGELDSEKLPVHRYILAKHSGFKRLLDSDVGGTRTTTVSGQHAIGVHAFNGLNETFVADTSVGESTPAVPMQTTSATGAGTTGGSKGVFDKASLFQTQTTTTPFDYSDPGQAGVTKVVKTWKKNPHYGKLAFAKDAKDDSSVAQVAVRKVLIGSSAENQIGTQAKEQTYAHRAFHSYTAPGKQFNGTEQAGLGVRVPLPVPGLNVSLSGNFASAKTTTRFDPEQFTYGNDVGARAIVTTKLQDALLGHKVTAASIDADSQRFIEILATDTAQKQNFLGDTQYDVISSTLSQYRNALLLDKDGNFDHPVRSPALSLLKTPSQQRERYSALHDSKGAPRQAYLTVDDYVDKAGFMGYINANVASDLNTLMATTWREKSEGLNLPLPADVDRLLATKRPDGLTQQQYLKNATREQRLAFYQDTDAGKQMLKDFLKVSDFAAHQNDFVFTHNSYKYRIDPHTRSRQAGLINPDAER